jgi:nucleoid-associated protein YejK
MNIKIRNAVLHIIKNDGSPPLYSEKELDLASETCEEFICKHVRRLWNSHAAREAAFNPDSAVYYELQKLTQQSGTFKETARFMAERLTEILSKHTSIPPAGLLIVRFGIKNDDCIGIFKLNYKECFTHAVSPGDIQLVKNRSVLPTDGGKVEEACIIPLSPIRVKLIEKAHVMDGTVGYYFSETFLECAAGLSPKEQTEIIGDVTAEFVHEYWNGDVELHAKVKHSLVDEAEDADDSISMENVAARVFPDEADAKDSFVHTMREAGIIEDLPLDAKFVRRQFAVHRIKADNGIEVKFPTELAGDSGQMEIDTHLDGTVTVTLKRMRVV